MGSIDTHASKGGRARAEKLSRIERSNSAQHAANARWNAATKGGQAIPKATHPGDLKFGEMIIPCAVLEPTGKDSMRLRVLSERGVAKIFGKTGRGSPSWIRSRQGYKGPSLPLFISAKNLIPYIPSPLLMELSNPILYKTKRGGATAYGIEARLLGDICKVWIDAGKAGALRTDQEHIARKAEILRDALVGVALVALVDDATGYVKERDRDELNRILEAYVGKEFIRWSKVFPDEYYEELFRLRKWAYSPPNLARPSYVGTLTNQLVYAKLPPGVLNELRSKNPVIKPGYRRYKHFQFLTKDIGNPHLEKHLASVITLMRISNTWAGFKRVFDKAFLHSEGRQTEMELGIEE